MGESSPGAYAVVNRRLRPRPANDARIYVVVRSDDARVISAFTSAEAAHTLVARLVETSGDRFTVVSTQLLQS